MVTDGLRLRQRGDRMIESAGVVVEHRQYVKAIRQILDAVSFTQRGHCQRAFRNLPQSENEFDLAFSMADRPRIVIDEFEQQRPTFLAEDGRFVIVDFS